MVVPPFMRAAYIRAHGTADAVTYGELETPSAGPTDVLVRMEATTVNHVDLHVRSGAYATTTPFPFVLGRDLVGVVEAVGDGVGDTFCVGDRVWTNSLGHAGRQGSFAEYATVPSERLYHLPEAVDPFAAVVVLHTAATAHLGLLGKARLALGETVYVTGAGGGVGTAVVQLAHAAGARVIATAAPRDHDWCRARGADVVLDHAAPDVHDTVRLAAPDGVDVWWDNTGRHDLEAALPLMRRRGRMVVMAGMSATPTLPVGSLYTRDLSLLGFVISEASIGELAAAAQSINALLAAGHLVEKTGPVLRLAEARQAHTVMETGDRKGRIVVVP